jgi:hypothetical protein
VVDGYQPGDLGPLFAANGNGRGNGNGNGNGNGAWPGRPVPLATDE